MKKMYEPFNQIEKTISPISELIDIILSVAGCGLSFLVIYAMWVMAVATLGGVQ
jgi:hypothetical protein